MLQENICFNIPKITLGQCLVHGSRYSIMTVRFYISTGCKSRKSEHHLSSVAARLEPPSFSIYPTRISFADISGSTSYIGTDITHCHNQINKSCPDCICIVKRPLSSLGLCHFDEARSYFCAPALLCKEVSRDGDAWDCRHSCEHF